MREVRVAIDRVDHHFIEQLNPRHRNPQLHRRDDRPDCAFHRVERAYRCGNGVGQPMDPQRDLSDHTQRALGPDEQARQVVSGRRLSRAPARVDDTPVGEHHGETAHRLAHRPVSNRGRA